MRNFFTFYNIPFLNLVSDDGKPDIVITTGGGAFEKYGLEMWAMFALGVIVGFFLTLIIVGIKGLIKEYNTNKEICNTKSIKTNSGIQAQNLFDKIICDTLFGKEFKFEYKKSITHQDENGIVNEFHPDFYLTDYKLCIKHFDSHDKDREEKLKKFYKKHGYKFAVITNEDIKDIQSAIEKILLENDIVITAKQ